MPTFDQRIGAIAAETDNVFDRADVLRAGGTDEMISERLRHRRWRELHPGVYLFSAAGPTWAQRVRGALRACGPGAVVSHASAARLHGLDGAIDRDDVHITMGQTNGPVAEGAHVFRSRRPVTGVRIVDGLRVTSVERSLIDHAAVSGWTATERTVESALDRRLTTEDRIWESLVREGGRGVPGARRLRKIMATRPRGNAKSVLEIRVSRLLVDAGLDGFVRNLAVDEGRSKIDAAFVDELVAVEADSKQFHSSKSQRDNDKKRQRRLEALGWLFVRVTFEEAYLDPEGFVARVREALAQRRSSSAPILSGSVRR